ncbi:hypothetical protein J4Q44_G00104020 [Coregonus suidteri]|uniref:Uncharacterized protein n=1 Tax=Coregonus suidteri TaxID=861788 RepID=A0AAN8R098_9TELE
MRFSNFHLSEFTALTSQLTSRNVTLPPCLVFFGSSFSFSQSANQPVNEPAVALGNLLFVRVFLLLQLANMPVYAVVVFHNETPVTVAAVVKSWIVTTKKGFLCYWPSTGYSKKLKRRS